MHSPLTKQVETILRDCARTCILPYFGRLAANEIQLKSHGGDVVTIADQKAEDYLAANLVLLVPDSVVLGEEAYAADAETIKTVREADHIWIVDPLDGTYGFRHGKDDFCIMAALVRKGHIVGAWIYAPQYDKFAAWEQGEPVTINGTAVTWAHQEKPVAEMQVVNCIVYSHPILVDDVNRNGRSFAGQHSCISFGVDGIRMLEGKLDVLVFGRGNPWDIACVAAMIQAMGGKALKINGAAVSGDNLFTTGGAFLAVRSPDQWGEIRDLMLKGIDTEKHFA